MSIKHFKRSVAPAALSMVMLLTSIFTPAAFAAENEAVDDPSTDTTIGEEVEKTYTIEVSGDRGLDLASTKVIVEEGGEVSIEADAAIGFIITKVRLNDGTHMETAPVGASQLLLDGKVYRIDEADGRVALRLTNVQSDMQIHFFAEMDPNYKPSNQPFTVSISGEHGVKIDQAVTNITRGDDVYATAFAAPGFRLTKVRLEDGVRSATAFIAGKRIVLNGKAYNIENDCGYIKVHLTDIQSDIKVYFYADPIRGWGPGYPGWAEWFPDNWRPGGVAKPTDPSANELDIDISGSLGVELDNSSLSVVRGGNINVVGKAKKNFNITKIRVSDGIHTETVPVSSGCIWLGAKKYIIDVSGSRVTLRLTNVQRNISVHFFTNADDTNAVPYGYHGITLIGDDGVKLDEQFITVRKGNSTKVSARAKSGYEIVKVRVDYGDYQKVAYVADGRIEINGKTYRIDNDGKVVTISFTNVRDDITVRFYTDDDANEWDRVITVEGGEGIILEDDVLNADNGDDVNVIANVENGYKIIKVTLDDGKNTATAKVSAGRIVLSGRSYAINEANGRVTVRLKEVTEDIKVYFTTEVDSNNIPIKISDTSEHCNISVSSSFVKKGDSVIYTVTPAYGYAISTVTLRVGSKEATTSARAGVIKVGDKSYKMALGLNGVLTVYVENVQDAVKLSVTTINTIPEPTVTDQNISDLNKPNYGQYSLYLRSDVRTPYIEGYGNGIFGPKNTLTRAEAAVMLARLTNYRTQIAYPNCNVADVQYGTWYSNVVNAFYAAGIENSGAFRPNTPITRGELAVWLYRLSGSPMVGASMTFPDVYGSFELMSAVSYGRVQGWINGYPDGTYRPNSSLIRAEATKLLNHITSRSPVVTNMIASFTDVPYTYWAYHEIMSAANYV